MRFDWATSRDIGEMLEAIDDSQIEAQLRRFGVACARRALQFVEEPEFAIALELSDRFAEERGVESQLVQSIAAASALVNAHVDIPTVRDFAASSILDASSVCPCTKLKLRSVLSCAAQAIAQHDAESATTDKYDSVYDESFRSETDAQCEMLRRHVETPSACSIAQIALKALSATADDRPLPAPALADLVPQCVAKELRVVPLLSLGGTLVLAGPQRLGKTDMERLAFILNRRVHCTIRSDQWYERAWSALYPVDAESPSTDRQTWYWGDWHCWDGETLVVKASGWVGTEHWTGAARFPPDHDDYDLWRWIVSQKPYRRLIDLAELPQIRRVWRRWLARVGAMRPEPKNRGGGSESRL